MVIKRFIYLYLLFFGIGLQAQTPTDISTVVQDTIAPIAQDTTGDDRVIVDHSNEAEYEQLAGEEIQYLLGDVELRQENIYMYCDKAVIRDNNVTAVGKIIIQQNDSITIFADSLSYQGNNRIADLFGEVVLINGEKKLFTNRLNYDLKTKVATYKEGAMLTNKQTQLTSKTGYYYVNEDEAFFKDSVLVVDTNFTLRADTLKFNTETQIATFLGPTRISQNETKIYCEEGFYDTANKIAEFRKNAQYVKGAQQAVAEVIRYDGSKREILLEGEAKVEEGLKKANADLIRYNELTEETFLEGNAHYQDSTRVIDGDQIIYEAKSEIYKTKGRSLFSDPPQLLEADEIDYDGNKGVATGNVIWQDTSANIKIDCDTINYNKETDYLLAFGNRPLLTTLVEGDTLFMRSDTLISLRENPADSARTLFAYRDVRMFKPDLQAVCDSLVYSTADSLFKFYEDPIIWADTSQFSADTMHIQMKDGQIDRINLYSNSFILNSPDELFYNQIKGKDIIAYFVERNLRRMRVEGNAESVYYGLDESNAYIGVNKTVCSDMLLFFGNNKVENIKFFTDPQANFFPMQRVDHNSIKLPGADWKGKIRPLSLADLF
ncbi:MAG: OstA-like protein [Saprospiraceae bacterium]